jgi:ribosomal protein S14
MNKNIQNIVKEKIKKTNLLKTEIIYKIKKSVIQNNNIKTYLKLYSILQTIKKNKKQTFLSKQHKICIITGKRSCVVNGFNYSRYKFKNLILENKLTNLKKNNW